MRKIWTPEELSELQEFCKASRSFPELKEKIKDTFNGGRSWLAVRGKVYQNKNWFSHFANEDKLLNFLKQNGQKSLKEISAFLDIPKEEVYPLRDALAEKGYDIEIKDSHVLLKSEPIDAKPVKIPKITSNVVKVLVLSDLCFGIETQQPTLVETAYKIGEEAGVFFAIICGNIVAGKPPKGKEEEYFLQTYEEQLQYAIKHLPKASFKTTFINGPREMSWLKATGENIGKELAKAREDLSYKDDLKANFHIGKKDKTIIAVMHAGESSAYTKSYTLQGIAENLQEAERYVFEHSEPLQMVIIGGAHTIIRDPRRLPIKKTRINDFCKVAIPSLYRVTKSQAVSKRRGGSPVLGFAIISFEFKDDGCLKSLPICEFYNMTSYFKDNDFEDSDSGLSDKNLTEQEKNLLLLLKKLRRLGALARIMNISEEHIMEIIKNLEGKGFTVPFEEASKSYRWLRPLKDEFKPIDAKQFCVKSAKVLSFSDTHLGHKHERPDLIKKVYEIAEEEKVDAVFHSGDVFEGEGAFKGQSRELIYGGADEQMNHGLEIWPISKIPTYIIRGSSHEKAFIDQCGHDIVNIFARLARSERGVNITALLDDERITGSRGVVDVKGIKFCLDHPSGGIPYGKSYRPQKLIENIVSEMELASEAKIWLLGHLHVAFCMLYKGVVGFLVPCFEEKTNYIEAKGYTPWLGCWIIDVTMDQFENITKIVPRYVPFESKKQHKIYKAETVQTANRAEHE